MKLMEEKILTDGIVLPGNILKVGGFLNQQVDVEFMTEVCKEIARLFKDSGATKVMTIEASGIPFATLIAQTLGIQMIIVKKHASANLGSDVYAAEIYSYTHGNAYQAVISKEYLNAGDKILIADDFLACGNAIKGMRKMIDDAGATLVGCAAAIEKGFQCGGDELRAEGIHVESLAIVDSMDDEGNITFRS